MLLNDIIRLIAPKQGHHFPDAAIIRHLLGMPAFIQHADDQEETASADAMVDHLQGRALQTLRVQRENADHNKPKVTDGGISNQFLDVILRITNPSAINDPNHPQERDGWRPSHSCIREQCQVEANDSVSAHFQQDTRKNNRPGCRRLHVGIRQPTVEGKDRHLYGKRHQEAQKQETLNRAQQEA